MKLLELDAPSITHELYLEKEIAALKKPAGWYGCYPTRVSIAIPRGGRGGRQGYRIPALGVCITEKEFNRLARLGQTREVE